MKRFLILWLTLGAVLAVVTTLTSWFVFHHADLRFSAFAGLLVIPACQAAVVLWVSRRWKLSNLVEGMAEVLRHPLAATFLAADLAFLAAGWLARSHRLIGITGAHSLHPAWILAKVGVAAVLVAVAVGWRGPTVAERVSLAFFAILLVALGASAATAWPTALVGLLPRKLPLIVRWLVVYGGVFLVAAVALLQAADAMRRRAGGAGFLLEGAAAASFAVALIAALSTFSRPYLVEPWASAVRAGASFSAGLVVAGMLVAWAAPGRQNRR
ncbi:MAG: hypothetical protein V1750_04985 [Acidobacteriota bacterium]